MKRRLSALRTLFILSLLFLCGVAQGNEELLSARLKQAQQGDAQAQLALAKQYANGIGVPKSYPIALGWLKKAATQGLAEAQYYLGWLHAHGKGLPLDPPQAVYWITQTAEQNDVQAQYLLAQFYDNGFGVAQNTPLAKQWYHKACLHRLQLACLKHQPPTHYREEKTAPTNP